MLAILYRRSVLATDDAVCEFGPFAVPPWWLESRSDMPDDGSIVLSALMLRTDSPFRSS